TLRIPVMYRPANAKVWAEEVDTNIRRDLTLEESDAFWAWATFEVLSRTGVFSGARPCVMAYFSEFVRLRRLMLECYQCNRCGASD
ncbi:MAG: hypothetical protein JO281_12895, partial [Pseudonocardiales bacterium]|nr:hypothetical protein [Pseudonocardiales bacterium]